MNKSMCITIHFLIFFSYSISFTMENTSISLIDFTLKYPDVKSKITDELSKLSKEDKDDIRLVCKQWAKKGPDWYFMPDSVEKEFDKVMIKEKQLDILHKSRIVLILTYKNDLNAIRWIINNKTKFIDGRIKLYSNQQTILWNSIMIAIYNNHREIAQLLIETNPLYKDQNWKTIYNTITLDQRINEYFYTTHNRDFSFLPYIISIFTDDAHNLEKLYTQKKPLPEGQRYLLGQCLRKNALKCFDILLKYEELKNIIHHFKDACFEVALKYHNKDIAQKLIENEIYDINHILEKNTTILDTYYNDNRLKNDTLTQALLINLGAKTYADLQKEKICCTIQ